MFGDHDFGIDLRKSDAAGCQPPGTVTYYISTQSYAGRSTPRLNRPARLASEQLIIVVEVIALT
jgi:hypothetical protein